MTEYGLTPAYGDVAYHSSYGSHHAIVPTLAWNSVPFVTGGVLGSYTNWSSLPCDGEAMWDDFVANFLGLFTTSVHVDTVTIYTKADEESPAIPRALKAYGDPGTSAIGGFSKAVQRTWNLRDTMFNVVKYVMLDTDSGNDFNKTTDITGSADAEAFFGTVSSPNWAFSSRARFRPSTLQSVTLDLNDKLRKEYGMS